MARLLLWAVSTQAAPTATDTRSIRSIGAEAEEVAGVDPTSLSGSLLVAEHVGTNGACYETAYGTQSSTTQLVSEEGTTSTSNEGRA